MKVYRITCGKCERVFHQELADNDNHVIKCVGCEQLIGLITPQTVLAVGGIIEDVEERNNNITVGNIENSSGVSIGSGAYVAQSIMNIGSEMRNVSQRIVASGASHVSNVSQVVRGDGNVQGVNASVSINGNARVDGVVAGVNHGNISYSYTGKTENRLGKFCSKCGTAKHAADQKFCIECGNKLTA